MAGSLGNDDEATLRRLLSDLDAFDPADLTAAQLDEVVAAANSIPFCRGWVIVGEADLNFATYFGLQYRKRIADDVGGHAPYNENEPHLVERVA